MLNKQLFVVILLFAGATLIIEGDAKPETIVRNDIKGRLLTPEEGCGQTDVATTRIVGGSAAKKGAWPWMALLGKYYSKQYKIYTFHCGGSLITSRHVLSAAHCFKLTFDIVRLGEYNTSVLRDENRADIPIKSVDVHEKYIEVPKLNDIAIVHLLNDVEFTDYIRPICLPTSEEMRTQRFVGSMPFVAGWGHLKEKTRMSNILQQVQIPLVTNYECRKKYEDAGRFVYKIEYRYSEEYVICAGWVLGGQDACQGDSGGPLMLPVHDNGRFPFYQIGIVSYGEGCGRPNTPGVYTNVRQYADWILEKLQNSTNAEGNSTLANVE